ncbi:MAG: FAD-binding oxidoreductase [Myxococcaceae bacterium]|nr:FAD-binding oxidoreductase [Myxococcaceae bacterium]
MKTLLQALGPVAQAVGDGLVLRPASERELVAVLAVLRDRQASLGAEVMLDRSALARLGAVQDRAMTLEAGAGVPVRVVESKANHARLTLGPLSPMAWEASVGELVEHPALAFRAVVPGRLEPIAAGITGVLADGHLVRSAVGPRHAAGPDLASLLVGGGGALGLVTAAVLRLMPLHDAEQRRLFSFGTFAQALEATREALSAGVTFARAVLRGRAGRTVGEYTLRGAAAQVDRELELLARCAEHVGGRFEGLGREAEVDGPEREASWADLASALGHGGSVELFRPALTSVIARGVAAHEFIPPGPLFKGLRAAFDRSHVLGRGP